MMARITLDDRTIAERDLDDLIDYTLDQLDKEAKRRMGRNVEDEVQRLKADAENYHRALNDAQVQLIAYELRIAKLENELKQVRGGSSDL
jgi:plasmid stabilization system protein ParE